MNQNQRYKFYRNETGKWEDVNPDDYLWQWEAEYQDGSILKQFETENPLKEFTQPTFRFHQVREINVAKLKYLHIVSPRMSKRHAVIWNPRWQPIIIYKRASLVMKVWWDKKHFDKTKKKVAKKTERHIYTAFCYGYINKVGGIALKHFTVIMPQGEFITTDDLSNIKLDATPKEEWI